MVSFPISEKKQHALAQAMERLGIRESDLEESFVRSGGPGGQNVNKVSTCVRLEHRPTGFVVKCQQERSQALNRYYARCLLVQKIDMERRGRESEEAKRIAKIRRQKRKRSKRAKDKILEGKSRHGEKKQLRGKIFPD